ncbi:hypothetical protein GQ600_3264 [Phytophthora cactorum]|nr:hypothetical protein GQ600_3264 [Phytophthora cactorum]
MHATLGDVSDRTGTQSCLHLLQLKASSGATQQAKKQQQKIWFKKNVGNSQVPVVLLIVPLILPAFVNTDRVVAIDRIKLEAHRRAYKLSVSLAP